MSVVSTWPTTSGHHCRLKHSRTVCRRYGSKLQGLREVFSEYGLIKARILVECRWLQHLAGLPEVQEVPALEQPAQQLLEQLCSSFSVEDAQEVKEVSPPGAPLRCRG